MKLENHIANRFLTDTNFMVEMLETQFSLQKVGDALHKANAKQEPLTKEDEEVMGMVEMIAHRGNTNYYITDTVVDKLDILKIKRKPQPDGSEKLDWTIFNHIPTSKKTFIFADNTLMRVVVSQVNIAFMHLHFDFDPKDLKKNRGLMDWELFYVNRMTGYRAEHLDKNKKMADIELLIYKIMCFFHLSENEEIIVPAHTRYGTRKQGKIHNILPFPLIIVNSKWNITSINNNAFQVSPYLAIRWTGVGREIPKMVMVDQYEKKGYTRKAKNTTVK